MSAARRVDARAWTESITVDRPDTDVFLTLSDLAEVQQWSSWLQAPGAGLSVEGDGTSFGSALVRRDRAGSERARMTLLSARLDQVELEVLADRGRGRADVSLRYRLQDVGASATIVMLDVRIDDRTPAWRRWLGQRRLRRRMRALSGQDLQRLKAHVESAAR